MRCGKAMWEPGLSQAQFLRQRESEHAHGKRRLALRGRLGPEESRKKPLGQERRGKAVWGILAVGQWMRKECCSLKTGDFLQALGRGPAQPGQKCLGRNRKRGPSSLMEGGGGREREKELSTRYHRWMLSGKT